MCPVTLVVCFIPFLSTPSLGLSETTLNLENIPKHNISEGAHRHLKMSVWKLRCCFSSQGRTAVACAGSWKPATLLPLFGFLCCIKHRRQQPTLSLVLKSNYGGDDFSFKSYHPCTLQSKYLQMLQSPNPLFPCNPCHFAVSSSQ